MDKAKRNPEEIAKIDAKLSLFISKIVPHTI